MNNQKENYLTTQPLNHSISNPKVSVIMNCLNCSKYLREAIDSVYAQTYKDWEIIFWDNASTDSSADIAKGYDERLRYFRSEETVFLGRARNWAIEKARGEYIAFLDCDDIWMPTKLEKQISLFNDPEVGLVFCDSIFFNDKGDIKKLYGNRKPPRGNVFGKLLTNYFLSMETVVVRRRALESLDEWFDESFNMVEEGDLFRRVAYLWKFNYVDEPLSKWRIHGENWSLKRHNEFFPIETEMMIEKYCRIWKNFESEYASELHSLRAEKDYIHGLLLWEKKDRKGLRERIKPYLFTHKKYLIPFLLSFLVPYSTYYDLMKLAKKYEG